MISSYLLLRRVTSAHPYLNPGLEVTFNDLFDQIGDVAVTFAKIEDGELRKDFLVNLKQHVPEWAQYYADLFRFYLSKFIIDELLDAEKVEIIRQIFDTHLSQYRDAREPFVWLVRNISDEPWFADFEVPLEKILICKLIFR